MTFCVQDIDIRPDITENGRFSGQKVHTRFPPEPNGYLHIGHCKALCIDFGIAEKFGGITNLRMDDTNPAKEDCEYVQAIQQDIHWLGFDWGDRFYFGSDYFEKDYEFAVELIKKGLAYVCELSAEDFSKFRGNTKIPAISPYRNRSIKENLYLFERMRNGDFEEGKYTLRAKIDLESGNFNMRDPVIYRIRYIKHHRQGSKWCIFPMYDFAHPIQDALEGITHSLCSLEYEDHRPLYEWVINNVSVPTKPRQIEFARLDINYTVLSKRKLRRLVEDHLVTGWDDPRMPTLCGLRRRGYTPKSIRDFCENIGVSKVSSTVDYAFLESCLRDDLNKNAPRRMAVLNPIKLILTNYPKGKTEILNIENNPNDKSLGTRSVSFSRELYIELDDFMENPIPKYKRLFKDGPECRLKGAYIIKCTGYKKNTLGCIEEIYATYDPESRGGAATDGRKIKGSTLHWVDANNAIDFEAHLYSNLFSVKNPDDAEDYTTCINPKSLKIITCCKGERSIENVTPSKPGETEPSFQFLRLGYFALDYRESTNGKLVFNLSVPLKDSFKKHTS